MRDAHPARALYLSLSHPVTPCSFDMLTSPVVPLHHRPSPAAVCQCPSCGTLTMLTRCPNCDVATVIPGGLAPNDSQPQGGAGRFVGGQTPQRPTMGFASATTPTTSRLLPLEPRVMSSFPPPSAAAAPVGERPSRSGSAVEGSRTSSPHLTGPAVPLQMPVGSRQSSQAQPPSAAQHITMARQDVERIAGELAARQRDLSDLMHDPRQGSGGTHYNGSTYQSSLGGGESGFRRSPARVAMSTAAAGSSSVGKHELQELWRTIRRQNEDLERARMIEAELTTTRERLVAVTAERDQLIAAGSKSASAARNDAELHFVERESELLRRLEDAEARARSAEAQLEAHKRKVVAATEEVLALQQEVSKSRMEDKQELASLHSKLRMAEAENVDLRQLEQRNATVLRTLESELKSLRSTHLNQDGNVRQLEVKVTEATVALANAKHESSRAESALELERVERAALSETNRKIQAQVQQLLAERDTARAEWAEAQRTVDDLRATAQRQGTVMNGRVDELSMRLEQVSKEASEYADELASLRRASVASDERLRRQLRDATDKSAVAVVVEATGSPPRLPERPMTPKVASGGSRPIHTDQEFVEASDAVLRLQELLRSTEQQRATQSDRVDRVTGERDRALQDVMQHKQLLGDLRRSVAEARQDALETATALEAVRRTSIPSEAYNKSEAALQAALAELASMKADRDRRVHESESMSGDLSTLRIEHARLKAEVVYLREQVGDSDRRVESTRSRELELSRAVEETRGSLLRVQAELAAHLESSTQAAGQLRAQVSMLTRERDTLAATVDVLQRDKTAFSQISHDVESLETRLKDERQRHASLEKDHQDLIDTLRRDVASARLAVEASNDRADASRLCLARCKDLLRRAAVPEMSADGAGRQPSPLSGALSDDDVPGELQKLCAEKDRCAASWRRAEELLMGCKQSLEQQILEERTARQEFEKKAKNLEKQVQSLQQSNEGRVRDVFGELQRERESLNSDISALHSVVAQERHKENTLKAQVKELEAQLSQSKTSTDQLQTAVQQATKDRESALNAAREARVQIDHLRSELSNATHNVGVLEQSYKEQGKMLQQLRDDKDRLVQEVSKGRTAADEELAEWRVRFEDVKQQHAKDGETLRASLKLEREKVLREIERAHIAESLSNELRSIADAATAERDRSAKELDLVRSSQASKADALTSQVEVSHKERDGLRRQVAELRERVDLYTREMEVLKNDKLTLEAALNDAVADRDRSARLVAQTQGERDGALRLLAAGGGGGGGQPHGAHHRATSPHRGPGGGDPSSSTPPAGGRLAINSSTTAATVPRFANPGFQLAAPNASAHGAADATTGRLLPLAAFRR